MESYITVTNRKIQAICRNVTEKGNAVGTTQRQLVQQRDIKQRFAGHKRMPVLSTICCWQDKQAPDVNFFLQKKIIFSSTTIIRFVVTILNRFSSALHSCKTSYTIVKWYNISTYVHFYTTYVVYHINHVYITKNCECCIWLLTWQHSFFCYPLSISKKNILVNKHRKG